MRFSRFAIVFLIFASVGAVVPMPISVLYAADHSVTGEDMGKTKPSNSKLDSHVTTQVQTEDNSPSPTLEQTKQELEIAKLRKDIGINWIGIFTAIGAFVTTLGIIGTLTLGIRQLQQTQVARNDERFERAITRLGSQQASERLTGLAGIQQFLQGDNPEQQENALRCLVNAAVIEHDPTVRSAMVDIFETLPKLHLNLGVLNSGLVSARDRNRAVYRQLRDAFLTTQIGTQKLQSDPSYTEVSIGNPSPEDKASLEASAKAVAALVRAGARVDDLSEIYCPECIFSDVNSPTNLSGVNFDSAILRRASFQSAQLQNASFRNADLMLTNFISADLQFAKITADVPYTPWNVMAALYSGNLATAGWGANFSCSDLSHADFSGRMIMGLIYQNPVWGGAMHDEFQRANVTGTNFSQTQMLVAIPESLVPSSPDGMRMMPRELQPFMFGQTAGPMGPVEHFNAGKYLVWNAVWGSPELPTVPFPQGYTRDIQIALSSLYAARNIEKAQLPQRLISFVEDNRNLIRKPASTWDCTPR
jgi:Pentapeptide repeats (8 copies)